MPQPQNPGICAGPSPRPAKPRQLRVARPAVETLENRQFLSAITFSGGVLTLNGASNRQNHLYVDVVGSQYLATDNGDSMKLAPSSVKKIIINGGNLADRAWVNTKITAPCVIQTFGGNDVISGGSGNDSIVAGTGNDVITGNAGNDTIVAGDGQDRIYGGDGNDLITCGNGNNYVTGDAGNDTITTGSGNDTLFGGAGNDMLSSGAGNDSLTGDSGNDTLLGGDGNDTLRGGTGADNLDGGSGKNTYPDLSADDFAPAGTIASPVPQPAALLSGLVAGGVAKLTSTITGSNNGDSSAPTPVIQMIGATGTGPHTVFVQALDSTLGAGDPLTTHYQWDFGDPSSKYNTLTGWNAAHTYDQPGAYTVTLTITNSLGNSSSLTAAVVVTPDTRRTIYVDNSGSDNNSGASPLAPVRTAARAMQLLGAGVKLLFHAGQTFNVAQTIAIPYRNVLVGSYGDGANPVLMRVAGVGTSIFGTFDNSANVIIQNLVMDSPWKAVNGIANAIPADGIFAGGDDITVRNCTFLNLVDAIDADRNPTGMLVQDNTAPLVTGLRGYFVWAQGSDQVIIGNTVANSTREHVVRCVDTVRELIAYNDFTNLNRGSIDDSDDNKGTLELHRGSYAYVTQNSFSDGELRTGPRGGSSDIPGSTTSWTVIESNHISNHELQVYPGTQHLMVRNNVLSDDNGACINIIPSGGGRNLSDIRIVNNTGINNGAGGQFLFVYAGATPRSISVMNNLWIAPHVISGEHATAAIDVAGKDLSEFATISHNVWQMPIGFDSYTHGGVMYMWPSLSDPRGYITPSRWNAMAPVSGDIFANTAIGGDYTPSMTSLAAVKGVAIAGVFDDFYGNDRTGALTLSVGAVQV